MNVFPRLIEHANFYVGIDCGILAHDEQLSFADIRAHLIMTFLEDLAVDLCGDASTAFDHNYRSHDSDDTDDVLNLIEELVFTSGLAYYDLYPDRFNRYIRVYDKDGVCVSQSSDNFFHSIDIYISNWIWHVGFSSALFFNLNDYNKLHIADNNVVSHTTPHTPLFESATDEKFDKWRKDFPSHIAVRMPKTDRIPFNTVRLVEDIPTDAISVFDAYCQVFIDAAGIEIEFESIFLLPRVLLRVAHNEGRTLVSEVYQQYKQVLDANSELINIYSAFDRRIARSGEDMWIDAFCRACTTLRPNGHPPLPLTEISKFLRYKSHSNFYYRMKEMYGYEYDSTKIALIRINNRDDIIYCIQDPTRIPFSRDGDAI